ncbi:magnesium chelatase subunit D [Pararhizobium mangrovi]|uniref:Magnesium chelatase subunit D n=1 Tax=Pararhizobium mangrovi TaxID=2590452 RepID=A0A506UCY7_9HYPH|nr:magnesium chelatase subunit D [Pararhizobium mangrovi]TPW29607.1 magnesium chelatase subunit D [Pararhizobium mangrovi]
MSATTDDNAHDGPPPVAGDALAIFLADPPRTGLHLRARHGPTRAAFLAALSAWGTQNGRPIVRVPAAASESALLGGLDTAATLATDRAVFTQGLLARADGGVLVVASAERMTPVAAGHIAAAIDAGTIAIERDGLSETRPARFALVLLDEGADAEEAPPDALTVRCAIRLDLPENGKAPSFDPAPVSASAANAIAVDDRTIREIADLADGFGIADPRRLLQALAVARLSAVRRGHPSIEEDDVAMAVRLVLGPRASRMPHSGERDDAERPNGNDAEDGRTEPRTESDREPDGASFADRREENDAARAHNQMSQLTEILVEAARSALPDALAEAVPKLGSGGRSHGTIDARRKPQRTPRHGRPLPARQGRPGSDARLDLIATLRAAAPWQTIRRRERAKEEARDRILVRPSDFRVRRFRATPRSTIIFVVDASGSAALERLAEAKGAVEHLLAGSYRRRDRVALVTFRGERAELALSPTRSLASARRMLAGLPGGGGTPLAAALEAAYDLARRIEREDETPSIVLLTDGRANIARDGTTGRKRAVADAETVARVIRSGGITAALVDISARPRPEGRSIAAAMGARYLPLPHAGARAISRAVETLRTGESETA